jgi:3-oxo-5-alpha-steroid 4-dehydrogenase 1
VTEAQFHFALLVAWFALAAAIAPFLLFVSAPYGRHARSGWGPRMNGTAGWVLMEAVSPLAMAFLFAIGTHRNAVAVAFLAMWLVHYVHRSFVFPFRRRGGAADMPVAIVLMGVAFNTGNGYLNGRWLFALGPAYEVSWLWDPRFVVGLAMFFAGFAINLHSDHVLFNLRGPRETGYKIPQQGFHRLVASPNYFGEIVEWFGFALATWSVTGLSFAVWTAANLAPRAWTHLRWYRATFPDYPKDRRALVPFVW